MGQGGANFIARPRAQSCLPTPLPFDPLPTSSLLSLPPPFSALLPPSPLLSSSSFSVLYFSSWAETWRRVWGVRKKFREPNFRMTFFRKHFHFDVKNLLMIFFSHQPYFAVFCHLPVSTVNVILCNIYDHFSFRKPLFQNKTFLHDTFLKSQFVLCRASNNTTSLNIGGMDAWAVPHLKFWGDRPPSLP